jgi:hypothetical protein
LATVRCPAVEVARFLWSMDRANSADYATEGGKIQSGLAVRFCETLARNFIIGCS